jgi:hypothetical protein
VSRRRRIVLGTVGAGLLAFVIAGLSRVTVCPPSVDSADISVGIVKKGFLPHDLFGPTIFSAIQNGLFVERPAYAKANGAQAVFKLADQGEYLVRVDVKFGRASPNGIEVLSGLKQGDRIVISDMSAWDDFDRLRLR